MPEDLNLIPCPLYYCVQSLNMGVYLMKKQGIGGNGFQLVPVQKVERAGAWHLLKPMFKVKTSITTDTGLTILQSLLSTA